MSRRVNGNRSRLRPGTWAVLMGCVLAIAWAPLSAAGLRSGGLPPRLLEAWSYCAYGLSRLATPIFQQVAANHPDDPEAYLALALIADAGGRGDEALKRYGQAAARSSSMDGALLTLQGDVYLQRGEALQAISRYRAALEIDAQLARAHYGLGVATEFLGRGGEWPPPGEWSARGASDRDWRSEAIRRHYAALEQAPDLTDAHVRVGKLLIEAVASQSEPSSEPSVDKLQEAIDQLIRARRLNERNPQVHLLLGRAYEGTGEMEKARHAYKRARQLEEVRNRP